MQEMELVEISAMQVVGLSAKTTNEIEATKDGRIVKLHQLFEQNEVSGKINADDDRLLAVYSDYEDAEKGEYRYLVGHVTDHEIADLNQIWIPAGKYLRFSSQRGFLSEILPQAWQTIWRLSEEDGLLGYKRSYTIDFEFHNYQDRQSMDTQVDIYLSVI
jgi:predicted transcriptional regulator YdeE